MTKLSFSISFSNEKWRKETIEILIFTSCYETLDRKFEGGEEARTRGDACCLAFFPWLDNFVRRAPEACTWKQILKHEGWVFIGRLLDG